MLLEERGVQNPPSFRLLKLLPSFERSLGRAGTAVFSGRIASDLAQLQLRRQLRLQRGSASSMKSTADLLRITSPRRGKVQDGSV